MICRPEINENNKGNKGIKAYERPDEPILEYATNVESKFWSKQNNYG